MKYKNGYFIKVIRVADCPFCCAVLSPLTQAITTPAMAVSHIMLESYKKYILVSLILLGKVQQLPKYTSQIVGRFIKVSFLN